MTPDEAGKLIEVLFGCRVTSACASDFGPFMRQEFTFQVEGYPAPNVRCLALTRPVVEELRIVGERMGELSTTATGLAAEVTRLRELLRAIDEVAAPQSSGYAREIHRLCRAAAHGGDV